jgi:tetratricopeptide (TPR) repeat protein
VETGSRLIIAEFTAPRDPAVAVWGRQVPAILHRRLAKARGLRARLWLEPAPIASGWHDAVLRGEVTGGVDVMLALDLRRAPDAAAVFERRIRFRSSEFFQTLDRLADDVARALGAAPPPARVLHETPSFPALRDYLRAIDLSEETDLPLELEDRRRKLEWLLLSVEADPAFRPAADALLEAGLRAHEQGLVSEACKALELLSRLAPHDPRAPYVLGELAYLDSSVDQAAAYFRRCLARDPAHRDARFRLGLIADEEGDRRAAKLHLREAGAGIGGRVDALVILGIICAEEGDRAGARDAWERAAARAPAGVAGLAAHRRLERLDARASRHRRR